MKVLTPELTPKKPFFETLNYQEWGHYVRTVSTTPSSWIKDILNFESRREWNSLEMFKGDAYFSREKAWHHGSDMRLYIWRKYGSLDETPIICRECFAVLWYGEKGKVPDFVEGWSEIVKGKSPKHAHVGICGDCHGKEETNAEK